MRELKELLWLVLHTWKANQSRECEEENKRPGFCSTIDSMLIYHSIESEEWRILIDWMYSQVRLEQKQGYLFGPFLHHERVEWLERKIKSVESC